VPELPEVETIRRDLARLLPGRTLLNVSVADPAALTGHRTRPDPAAVADFIRRAEGGTVRELLRRGKYLIMEFTDGGAILFHLRMTGQLIVSQPDGSERLRLGFSGGRTLCFRDRRRLGEALFCRDWREHPRIAGLGAEPLNGGWGAEALGKILRGRTAPIHPVLLNQKLVSGIGNIYATEALHRAGILPDRPAGKIRRGEIAVLAGAVRDVLARSVRNRGTSMDTYVDALGRKGRSQLFTAVYGKAGGDCPACHAKIRKKILGGRGVSYCPGCQR